jgi:hypothetical protein
VAFADEENSQGIQQDEEFDDKLYALLGDVGLLPGNNHLPFKARVGVTVVI